MFWRNESQMHEFPEFESKPHLLIVAARYQQQLVSLLEKGAQRTLDLVATHEMIHVPGSLEIAAAIRIASSAGKFDGFVALGCVIRGETSHYDIVCAESARGLTLLGISGLCIGNGILTLEDDRQGKDRADPLREDKGGEAAAAALHLIALTQRFGGTSGNMGFRMRDGGEAGRDPA